MPQPVKYINFRATLPGEHEPKSVRKCGAYIFVGGKYEVRIPEDTARRVSKVLETYYGCETEEVVTDAPVSAEDESTEPATSEVAETPSETGEGAGEGTTEGTADGEQSVETETGDSGPEASSEVGRHGSDNPDQPDTSSLV